MFVRRKDCRRAAFTAAVFALALSSAAAGPASAQRLSEAERRRCPDVYFFGVRGSSEIGFGAAVGAHENAYGQLVRSRLGVGAYRSKWVNYPASPFPRAAGRESSVRFGVASVLNDLRSQYAACNHTREVFAIAGMSQGAHAVATAMETLASDPADHPILDRIADVSLYGDPRRANRGGQLSWEIGESGPQYQGISSLLLGYPVFTANPIGSRLQSFCNYGTNAGDPPDPICAYPRERPFDLAYLMANLGPHGSYERTFVPQGASLAWEHTYQLLCDGGPACLSR